MKHLEEESAEMRRGLKSQIFSVTITSKKEPIKEMKWKHSVK